MKLNIRWLIVATLSVFALWLLYPTIIFYNSKNQDELLKQKSKIARNALKLGLDLKGGIHIVLEISSQVKSKEELDDAINRSIEILRNRVDKYGVAEPLIARQGEKWIVVQLPGVVDRDLAKELIGKTAMLEFRVVAPNSIYEEFAKKVQEENLESDKLLQDPKVLKMLPTHYTLLPGRSPTEQYFIVETTALITGKHIVEARVEPTGEFGFPEVTLKFDDIGKKLFANITEKHVKERLAIILDGVVQSAPVIEERIPTGEARIRGQFNLEEAKFLANILSAGALPVSLEIIEERTVGAALGEDSIKSGMLAVGTGLLLTFIFLLYYYTTFGVVAIITLIVNLVYLLSVLAGFKATLTLPGIAGIGLSIAMAVDACVLIFERIRDEILSGKTPKLAVEFGYNKVLSAIFDANITTLIAAVFLFQFGSGPIRGFATTLMWGIIISLFTSIFLSKTILLTLIEKTEIKLT
ncbi:MAG: protein translocase subunit SecD [bacterium]|nr:protein translocase subunit SecD [bacterium]